MKKFLYLVPVLVIVLLGFKLKVRAANDYKYYLHDGYVYWMPDSANFSTNNGLFTFAEFYESAYSPSQGVYMYQDVNGYFNSGDILCRVEIYQDGIWAPLDSYEMSTKNWNIVYNVSINDTGYSLSSGDFNFFYQISDNTLTDDDLAGIRFYYGDPPELKVIKVNLWEYGNVVYDVYVLDTVYRFRLTDFYQNYNIIENGNGIINTFNYIGETTESIRGWFYYSKRLYLQVEKSLIQAIMTRDSVDEVTAFKTYLVENNIYGYFESTASKRQDLIYNFNLMNYPEPNALYDANAYKSYGIPSQYLSVRFKSIDIEQIIDMNNGVIPEIIFKVNGVENNFYPYEEFKYATGPNMIRDRTFLFHVNEMYYKELFMAFNFRYPEYLNEYHQYMLDKAEVDIRKLQITIIFKDVLVESEMDISEIIQQAYNRGYSDGLTIGYEDAFNAGYDEGKRMGDILEYQYGYDAGYEAGLITGNEDAYNSGYDAGFIDGTQESEAYNVGYTDGANESFLGSMDKWLVPSIIIVMLLGGFFAIARKKRDGDI